MSFIRRSINLHARARALLWGTALASSAVAAFMFVVPAGAARLDARKPVTGAAAVPTTVRFTIIQPAASTVMVHFTSGITNISQERAAGDNMALFSANFTLGFIVGSTKSAPHGGAGEIVDVNGEITPGTPIVGNATLPSGATMTAQVDDGPVQTTTNGRFTLSTSTGVGSEGAPPPPTSKAQCKHGGWKNFGNMFKNQGDCMSYVANRRKEPAKRVAHRRRRQPHETPSWRGLRTL